MQIQKQNPARYEIVESQLDIIWVLFLKNWNFFAWNLQNFHTTPNADWSHISHFYNSDKVKSQNKDLDTEKNIVNCKLYSIKTDT